MPQAGLWQLAIPVIAALTIIISYNVLKKKASSVPPEEAEDEEDEDI